MQREDVVSASEFCLHHNIELSFIHSLEEHGMIETVLIEESIYLPVSQLENLERILRLHFELDINVEGIETISHLLEKMKVMQEEIINLKHRLKLYED
jgi:hypothetical protein